MGIDWAQYRPGRFAVLLANFADEPCTFLCLDELFDIGDCRCTRTPKGGARMKVASKMANKVTSKDKADGSLVLEEYVTMFIRGMTDGDGAGPDKPDHTFPEDARARPVGEVTIHVDDDQTYRYRDASGDMMPIHVDDNMAKSVGLPGIIAHGLCTMAMNSQAVVKTVADGDPARLKRLAVRFAKNVFPGNDVVTTIYDAGEAALGRKAYAFEAHSNGDQVIANGRAEVEA